MDNYCLQHINKWKWGYNTHYNIENLAQNHEFKSLASHLLSAICQSVEGQLSHYTTYIKDLNVYFVKNENTSSMIFSFFPLHPVNQVHYLSSQGELLLLSLLLLLLWLLSFTLQKYIPSLLSKKTPCLNEFCVFLNK